MPEDKILCQEQEYYLFYDLHENWFYSHVFFLSWSEQHQRGGPSGDGVTLFTGLGLGHAMLCSSLGQVTDYNYSCNNFLNFIIISNAFYVKLLCHDFIYIFYFFQVWLPLCSPVSLRALLCQDPFMSDFELSQVYITGNFNLFWWWRSM